MTTTSDIGDRLTAGTIDVGEAISELIGALAKRAPCPAQERAVLIELLASAVTGDPQLQELSAELRAAAGGTSE